jgi:hypothetical protein
MLIYEGLTPGEHLWRRAFAVSKAIATFERVCRSFRKPRYGNILQELIQVITTPIVTRGSYPRNGGGSRKRRRWCWQSALRSHSETVAVPAFALTQAGVS